MRYRKNMKTLYSVFYTSLQFMQYNDTMCLTKYKLEDINIFISFMSKTMCLLHAYPRVLICSAIYRFWFEIHTIMLMGHTYVSYTVLEMVMHEKKLKDKNKFQWIHYLLGYHNTNTYLAHN